MKNRTAGSTMWKTLFLVVILLVCGIAFSAEAVSAGTNEPDSQTESSGGKLSLIEKAPELIYAVRRYPKFYGDKNTVHGGIFERSYLFGDMWGVRDTLVDHGINIDIGVTQVFQWNVSGGRDIGSRYSGSGDLWVNFDTGKAGLWPGGNIYLHAETYWGNSVQDKVGSLMPVNFDSMLPEGDTKGSSALSEFYLLQGLPGNLLLAIGKLDLASLADTNAFANNERTQFLNTSLINNPMLGVYAPYTAAAMGLVWAAPSKKHELLAIVNNNEESAMTSGFNTLNMENTSFGTQYKFSPKIGGLPGNYALLGAYTSKDATDYASANRWLWAEAGRPILSTKTDNYAIMINFDQYLYMKNEEEKVGWGIFGRGGWSPKNRNFIDQFYSLGVGGMGCLIPGRDKDAWGLGWAGTHFSSDLRDDLRVLGISSEQFEHTFEAFYNIMITPAIHLSLNAQYILDPFSEALGVAGTDNHAFVLGSRLQLDF
jgi:carbohydrate-selective porin OprB